MKIDNYYNNNLEKRKENQKLLSFIYILYYLLNKKEK